jgi:hypothetical protein
MPKLLKFRPLKRREGGRVKRPYPAGTADQSRTGWWRSDERLKVSICGPTAFARESFAAWTLCWWKVKRNSSCSSRSPWPWRIGRAAVRLPST